MKRFFISMSLWSIALVCFSESNHRISLGAGILGHAYVDEFIHECTMEDYDYPGPKEQGTFLYSDEQLRSLPTSINLHYEYTLGKHFGVGLCFGYDRLKMAQETEVITSIGYEISPHGEAYTMWESFHESGCLRRHVLMFMPEFTVYWFKKNHVALYSQLAPGVRLNIEKREGYATLNEDPELKECHFTCQVSPVCAEFGGQYWRGFAEVGYGAQGVVQLGVKHTFKGKEKGNDVED